MAASQNHFKFAIIGFTKDRNGLLETKSSCVVFKLLVISLVPIRMNDRFEYAGDQLALFATVKVIHDFWLGDIPVIGNEGAKQTTLGIFVIPVKANFFSLILR